MNYTTLLGLIVMAIQTDQMHQSVEHLLNEVEQRAAYAFNCGEPIPAKHRQGMIEAYCQTIIDDASVDIQCGIGYGKYNQLILNYKQL